MKKKFKFINLLMPLVVVFAILFPAIHSYEHIHSHNSTAKKVVLYPTDKSEFKMQDHSNEECAICHFKFSPVSTFDFVTFQFYKNSTPIPYVHFYSKSFAPFFKGSLFALRAPPIA
ncbi:MULTISPECIES: hypothetical protein [Flavobacterium]|uniref:DUF2946 domain-containing protein n=1 Tax=Flavobacterium tructae TaxID=1114873 RepID=A0A1S1J1T6_9FLAO|nr:MULTISPECIES: hypothetical protein [Flavobacterium]OHT43449.1 hypothetical protein BHE19_16805 [Flavobacterium tructae]OXB17238.1 hypothetical protein B0A71_16555 [Flavobacterium tructae]URC11292.1 hypothetical protein M4I44_14430 [Flavobacterium sp. B183]